MVQVCGEKCEEEKNCEFFAMSQGVFTSATGKNDFTCGFFNETSIAAQHPVTNPVANMYQLSVFHKGDKLLLPEFKGCDVPVGNEISNAVNCYKNPDFLKDEDSGCVERFGSYTSDFLNYIMPAIDCMTQREEDRPKLQGCMDCLKGGKDSIQYVFIFHAMT